jgi:hypothetical protein
MKLVKHLPSFTPQSQTEDRLWRLDIAPRRIYVAASMAAQVEAMRFALQLMDAGFVVTSSWLRKDFSDKPDMHENWLDFVTYEEWWGKTDVEDLYSADTLIVLAKKMSSSGGFHTELGYFLGARRTNIIVVGDRPNVFFWTSNVRFTLSTEGLVEWLGSPEHGAVEPVSAPIFPPPLSDEISF